MLRFPISLLDFFGVSPIWYIHGHRRSSTITGLVFTGLLTAAIIWSIIYFSRDLVNRTNANITYSFLQGVSIQERFEVHPTNFQYMFGILNPNDQFDADETVFKIKATWAQDNQTSVNIKLKFCSLDDINNILPYPGKIFCFDPEQNLYLQGTNSAFYFEVLRCVNSTANANKCKSTEIIEEFMANSLFYHFYPIISIVPASFENPISRSWNYQVYPMIPKYSKIISSALKRVQLDTDDGWLLNTNSSFQQIIHDKFFVDVALPKVTDLSVIKVMIYNLGDVNYVTRRYPKVQDFLAQFFGVINFVYFIISLVVTPYERYKTYEYIGNHAFSLDVIFKKLRSEEERTQKRHLKSILLVTPEERQKHPSLSRVLTKQSQGTILQLDTERPLKSIKSNFASSAKPSPFTDGKKFFTIESEEERGDSPRSNLNDAEGELPMTRIDIEDKGGEETPIQDGPLITEMKEIVKETEENPDEYEKIAFDFSQRYEESIHSNTETGTAGSKKKKKNKFWERLKHFLLPYHENHFYTLNFFEWVLSFFKKNPKVMLLQRVQKEVMERLDVLTITKSMIELQLLKNFLLTDNQRILFDNLKAPKLNLKISDQKIGKKIRNKDFYFSTDLFLDNYTGRTELIEAAFADLQSDFQKTTISRKLISKYMKKFGLDDDSKDQADFTPRTRTVGDRKNKFKFTEIFYQDKVFMNTSQIKQEQ